MFFSFCKVQQEMNETVAVEKDRQKIEQESRIYGKADTDNLTKYQISIMMLPSNFVLKM